MPPQMNPDGAVKRVTQAERDAIGHVAVWRTDRFVKLLAVEGDTRDLLHDFTGRRFSRYFFGQYKEAKTNRCLPGLASKADITFRKPDREMDTSEEDAEERLILSDAVKQTKHLDRSPEPTLMEKLLTEPQQAYALRESSFYIWDAHTPPRILIYNLVKHKYFEAVIIFIILGNCVVLAMDDQIEEASQTNIPNLAENIDIFFTVAFSIEAVLKCYAMGFIGHRGAYLRDTWNILDFVILILAYVNHAFASGSDLAALRTLRVLRPLRSMNAVKGLKILVRSLIASVAALAPVFVMALFILFLGAVLSVQLFAGQMRFSCVDIFTGEVGGPCKQGVNGDTYWGAGCGQTEACVDVGNPGNGFYHFDNVLTALLVMFTFTSFDNWTALVNLTMAAVGTLTFAFFFLFVFVCGFIIPNLIFAALNTEYSRAQDRDRQYDIKHAGRVRRLVQQRTNMFKIMDSARAMRYSYRLMKEEEEKEKQAMMELQMMENGGTFMMGNPFAITTTNEDGLEMQDQKLLNAYNLNQHHQNLAQQQQQQQRESSFSATSTPRSNQYQQQHQHHYFPGDQTPPSGAANSHQHQQQQKKNTATSVRAAMVRSIKNNNKTAVEESNNFFHRQAADVGQMSMMKFSGLNNDNNNNDASQNNNYNQQGNYHNLNNNNTSSSGSAGFETPPQNNTRPGSANFKNGVATAGGRSLLSPTTSRIYIEDPTKPMEELFAAPKIALPPSRGPEMDPMWVTYDDDGKEIVPEEEDNFDIDPETGLKKKKKKGLNIVTLPPEDRDHHHHEKTPKKGGKHHHQHQHSATAGGGGSSPSSHHNNETAGGGGDNIEHVAMPAGGVFISGDSMNRKPPLDPESWEYRWKMIRKKWNQIRDFCHEITEGYERSVAGKLALVSGGESDFSEVSSDDDDEEDENRKKDDKQEESSSMQNVAAAESGETQSQSTFALVIVAFIIFNTIVLATQHANQPEWLGQAQDIANLIFTAVFAVEFVMRLMSLGFVKYFASSFNCLDALIVFFSFLELILEGASIVSVFRALRLLRVLKLLKQFVSLRALVRVAFAAVGDSSYLMLIILLYLFIFALVGKAFFSEAVTDPEARMTYTTFVKSFYTSFQVLTGDLWVGTMFDVMSNTHPIAAFYFVFQIIIGLFVLLALFLSILVETFAQMEQKSQFEIQEQDEIENTSNMFKQNMLDSEVVRKIYSYGSGEEDEEKKNLAENGDNNNDNNNNNENNNENSSNEAKGPKKKVTGAALALRRKSLERNNLSSELVKEFQRAKDFETKQDALVAMQLRKSKGDQVMHAKKSGALFGDQSPDEGKINGEEGFSEFSFPSPSSPKIPTADALERELQEAQELEIAEGFLPPENHPEIHEDINIIQNEGPFRETAPNITIGNGAENAETLNNKQQQSTRMSIEDDRSAEEKGAGISLSEVRALPQITSGQRLQEYLDEMYRPAKRWEGKWTTLGRDWPVAKSLLPSQFKEARLNRKMSQNAFFAPAPRHIRDIVPAIILFHEGPLPKDEPPKERHVICPNCGDKYKTSLPPAPLMAAPDPATYHQLQCRRIRIRKTKERILNEMLSIIRFYSSSGEETAIEKIQSMLQQCWECSTMTAVSPEDISENEDPWKKFAEEIEEQLQVLDLRSGEEELGHSLVAYAFACIPIEHKTNGGVALWLFGPDNLFRLGVSQLVYDPIFEWTIMICIIIASVLLGMSNPLDDPESSKVVTIKMINLVLTSIFAFEMVVKVIAMGFILHEGAYLRDAWNWLDFLVVVVSLITDTSDLNLGFLRVFRTLRAIRPLRLLNRSANLKNTVYAMGQNVKAIINVGFLSLIILFIFAILSVQLFQGRFRSCSDPSILDRANCTGMWSDPNAENFPSLVPRVFKTETRNFDDVAQALLTLFEISTGEAWATILYRSYDACDEDKGPQQDCSVGQGFFFVFFFAVSGFFLMQLFVSFILHNYEQVQAQVTGANSMTEEQKIWVQTQQLLVNLRPYVAMVPDDNKWSKYLYEKIVGSIYFDYTLATAIVLDVLTISMDHFGISAEFKSALQIMNIFFGVVFTLEAGIKIITFRFRYFKNNSNLFDFALVIIGFVGMGASNIQGVVVLRVFRMARLLRLVRSARGIQILLETLIYSLPQMANMAAFMIVITFSFAVLGVDMFAKLYIPPDSFALDNNYANFKRLDLSLMMLIRFLTFEDWVGAQRDAMIEYPKCTNPDSCGSSIAPLFFCSYVIITGFVILNLILAIILGNFELTIKLSGTEVKMGAFHNFVDIWSEYDENATMRLPTILLPRMLKRLGPPIGLTRVDSRNQIMSRLRNYFIPEHGDYIHFIEVLLALAQGSKKTDLSEYEQREYYERIRGSFQELLELPVYRHNNTTMTTDLYFAQAYMAAAHRRNMFMVRDVHTLRAEKREKLRAACEKMKITVPEPYFIPHYQLKLGSTKLLEVSSSDGFGDLPISVLKKRPPYSTAPLQMSYGEEEDDENNNSKKNASLTTADHHHQHDTGDNNNNIPHLVIGEDGEDGTGIMFDAFGNPISARDVDGDDNLSNVDGKGGEKGEKADESSAKQKEEEESPLEPPVEIFKMADRITKRKNKRIAEAEAAARASASASDLEEQQQQQQQQKNNNINDENDENNNNNNNQQYLAASTNQNDNSGMSLASNTNTNEPSNKDSNNNHNNKNRHLVPSAVADGDNDISRTRTATPSNHSNNALDDMPAGGEHNNSNNNNAAEFTPKPEVATNEEDFVLDEKTAANMPNSFREQQDQPQKVSTLKVEAFTNAEENNDNNIDTGVHSEKRQQQQQQQQQSNDINNQNNNNTTTNAAAANRSSSAARDQEMEVIHAIVDEKEAGAPSPAAGATNSRSLENYYEEPTSYQKTSHNTINSSSSPSNSNIQPQLHHQQRQPSPSPSQHQHQNDNNDDREFMPGAVVAADAEETAEEKNKVNNNNSKPVSVVVLSPSKEQQQQQKSSTSPSPSSTTKHQQPTSDNNNNTTNNIGKPPTMPSPRATAAAPVSSQSQSKSPQRQQTPEQQQPRFDTSSIPPLNVESQEQQQQQSSPPLSPPLTAENLERHNSSRKLKSPKNQNNDDPQHGLGSSRLLQQISGSFRQQQNNNDTNKKNDDTNNQQQQQQQTSSSAFNPIVKTKHTPKHLNDMFLDNLMADSIRAKQEQLQSIARQKEEKEREEREQKERREQELREQRELALQQQQQQIQQTQKMGLSLMQRPSSAKPPLAATSATPKRPPTAGPSSKVSISRKSPAPKPKGKKL